MEVGILGVCDVCVAYVHSVPNFYLSIRYFRYIILVFWGILDLDRVYNICQLVYYTVVPEIAFEFFTFYVFFNTFSS